MWVSQVTISKFSMASILLHYSRRIYDIGNLCILQLRICDYRINLSSQPNGHYTYFTMAAPPPRTPDDLLKWSIAAQNSSGQADGGRGMREIADEVAAGRRPDLADPALFDALIGKSEATMMKEELAVALNLNKTEQDRVQALDNFEMVSGEGN